MDSSLRRPSAAGPVGTAAPSAPGTPFGGLAPMGAPPTTPRPVTAPLALRPAAVPPRPVASLPPAAPVPARPALTATLAARGPVTPPPPPVVVQAGPGPVTGGPAPTVPPAPKLRTIAITSGKGGVGKSNVVANLAVAASRLGKNVIAFDADLGLANLDVIFGIRPQYTLYHVLKGKKEIFDIVVRCMPGVKFVAGGSGMQELADIDGATRERFVRSLSRLDREADVLFIDTGAGLSSNVMGFVQAADEVLLVTTPEPTAMADAYGVIKTMAATPGPFPRVSILVNRVRSPEEGTYVARRLLKVAEQFLEVKLHYGGYILDDRSVTKAVRAQKPFITLYPNSAAAVCVSNITANLFNSRIAMRPMPASGGFFERVAGFFRA